VTKVRRCVSVIHLRMVLSLDGIKSTMYSTNTPHYNIPAFPGATVAPFFTLVYTSRDLT